MSDELASERKRVCGGSPEEEANRIRAIAFRSNKLSNTVVKRHTTGVVPKGVP